MWDLNKYNNNIAIIDDTGTEVIYSELLHIGLDIERLVGRRQLVLCLCKNSIGSVVGYISFISHKIVPIMVNAGLEQELIDNLLNIYSPQYVWIPNELENKEWLFEFERVYECYDYCLYKTDYKKEYDLYNELGLLLTTSGSTGSSKYVRQSYSNILANAESIVEYLELNETERPITTLPMNYTYGLSIINSHMLVGATLLVTDRSIMQKEFWTFFKEYNATSFGGVPYTYEILNKLHFYRMDLPSLHTMTQAGGKLIPELHEKFAEYAERSGKQFVVMYGQCEATARMGYLPAEKAVEKCGSMGIAIPGGAFTLIDSSGKEINEPYVSGELLYRGENVTLGYAECGEDLIKGDERKGILLTGDMAQYDDEGYYYIVGRKKRFLKIYGNRVNLDEIDRMVKGAFEGIDCASSGVDDNMYIFVTDNNRSDDIKKYISEKTKLNSMAFNVVVIDEIPKNEAGKIMYHELEKYYLDGKI